MSKFFVISFVISISFIPILNQNSWAKDYDDCAVSMILNFPEAGLEVLEWNAWYRASDTITFGDAFAAGLSKTAPNVREAGFQYDLAIQNITEKFVVAFQVNVVVFNPWDEYLDTFGIFQGALIKPEKRILRKNRAMFNGDSQFFTFFIWVDKVRFEDGSTYIADIQEIKAIIDESLKLDFPIELLKAGNVLELNENRRFRERQYMDVYVQGVH
ncbi:hypothetical protein J7K50_09110 [bacterium]|nr:hypothetical protein [bacterium]